MHKKRRPEIKPGVGPLILSTAETKWRVLFSSRPLRGERFMKLEILAELYNLQHCLLSYRRAALLKQRHISLESVDIHGVLVRLARLNSLRGDDGLKLRGGF